MIPSEKHTSELESVSIPHYQFNPHSRTRLQPDIYSSTAFVTNVQIKPTLKENIHSNMNINAWTYSDLWDILFALVRHGLISVDADVFILFFSWC